MTTTDEKIDELARQVEAMTVALERLYALLSERPAGGGKRRAKPSPAQLAELQKTTAYKARVARAAKRYGVPPRRVARALRARRQAPARRATARPDLASRAVPADSSPALAGPAALRAARRHGCLRGSQSHLGRRRFNLPARPFK